MSMWIDQKTVLALPEGTAASKVVLSAAAKMSGPPVLDDDDAHNTNLYAAALVATRYKDKVLAKKVEETLLAIGTVNILDDAKKPLRCCRQLAAYIISYDMLREAFAFSGTSQKKFKAAIKKIITFVYPGGHSGANTIVETALWSANNHGTMARMSLAAACILLGSDSPVDIKELARCHAQWCGEMNGYAGLKYSDTTWHADPANLCGINRKGAKISGQLVDGIQPEEQRRVKGQTNFKWPPGKTEYVWGALQGALVAHQLLVRHGKVKLDVADSAMLRACQSQFRLGFPPGGDDVGLAHLANKLWPKANLPTTPEKKPCKTLGFFEYAA